MSADPSSFVDVVAPVFFQHPEIGLQQAFRLVWVNGNEQRLVFEQAPGQPDSPMPNMMVQQLLLTNALLLGGLRGTQMPEETTIGLNLRAMLQLAPVDLIADVAKILAINANAPSPVSGTYSRALAIFNQIAFSKSVIQGRVSRGLPLFSDQTVPVVYPGSEQKPEVMRFGSLMTEGGFANVVRIESPQGVVQEHTKGPDRCFSEMAHAVILAEDDQDPERAALSKARLTAVFQGPFALAMAKLVTGYASLVQAQSTKKGDADTKVLSRIASLAGEIMESNEVVVGRETRHLEPLMQDVN